MELPEYPDPTRALCLQRAHHRGQQVRVELAALVDPVAQVGQVDPVASLIAQHVRAEPVAPVEQEVRVALVAPVEQEVRVALAAPVE